MTGYAIAEVSLLFFIAINHWDILNEKSLKQILVECQAHSSCIKNFGVVKYDPTDSFSCASTLHRSIPLSQVLALMIHQFKRQNTVYGPFIETESLPRTRAASGYLCACRWIFGHNRKSGAIYLISTFAQPVWVGCRVEKRLILPPSANSTGLCFASWERELLTFGSKTRIKMPLCTLVRSALNHQQKDVLSGSQIEQRRKSPNMYKLLITIVIQLGIWNTIEKIAWQKRNNGFLHYILF